MDAVRCCSGALEIMPFVFAAMIQGCRGSASTRLCQVEILFLTSAWA